MTLELSDTAGLVAFVSVIVLAAVVGLALAAIVLVDSISAHRPVRLARHESVPAYYRGLLTSH